MRGRDMWMKRMQGVGAAEGICDGCGVEEGGKWGGLKGRNGFDDDR